MKILVLRFSSLGDVALTVPALKSVYILTNRSPKSAKKSGEELPMFCRNTMANT